MRARRRRGSWGRAKKLAGVRAGLSVVVAWQMIAGPDAPLVMMENAWPLQIKAPTAHQFGATASPEALTSAGDEVSGVIHTRVAGRFLPVNVPIDPTAEPIRPGPDITPRHNVTITLVRFT